MKILLASLLAASTIGSVTAPTISNLVSANNVDLKQDNPEFYELKDIPLGEYVKLQTSQSYVDWSVNIKWSPLTTIKRIKFYGDALKSYAAWGDLNWTRTWKYIDVDADGGTEHYLQDDTHTDFMAEQHTRLSYTFTKSSSYDYKLSFHFYTQSAFSGTGSWGNLTIGEKIAASSNRI